MKGFDGQFIMAWLLEQGTAPEVIPNGSKVMVITHTALNIKLIDSFNFLPMALSKLPACFGLTELKKGYFPHLFNKKENQNYVGFLPEPKYYNPDCMTSAVRTSFLEWHKEHEKDIFDFQEEILTYCRSDVDILRRCCVEFRNQFLEITGVDPFCYITIASACMAVYRSRHIIPNTIAMIPVGGYINRTNHSPDCIRWLDFIAQKESIEIEHALNGKGERRLDGISVDGYCKETNTVYQYYGCFFHGCSTCFDGDALHPITKLPMSTLRQQTVDKTYQLRDRGYNVIEMWEHDEFEMKKKTDEKVKYFLLSHELQDRLNPKDAFFGGRTNAIQLYYEGDAKYVDFTSLYPWVNKYCLYPVGHPNIITENFDALENYFGIIKCRILPPRGLYLPVLPYRAQNKLMFPLCKTCAELMYQGICQHSDDERAIIGTWVTEEVKLAVKKGYCITKIYEVYHFSQFTDTLFQSYINLFLKIKQESSGWPADCVSSTERKRYIEAYFEREGVQLDEFNIKKNPGRRQVAKLALNSFWGRWGMNLNKIRLTYVHTLPDFNKLLADPTKNIKDLYFPTPEVAAVQWDYKHYFVPQDTSTNVFLAAFTTAWARLKLYSEMEKLGRAVLYHDTDSIIYASDFTNDPPLG
ncbi:uncharacterized protein LOC118192299 [Stegodyphus dumicola]|uniref:uncharacterized protein LOC118192299 n=1 Tax=Stegodyphus dumicola TaxID=202533 RepID=UPI0015AEAF30|nr:uncharacterized protein LOC118192299 [Stegodyphus dumicola]